MAAVKEESFRNSAGRMSSGPPSGRRGRILLVEDDPQIAAEVIADLTERGYALAHVTRGDEAIEQGAAGHDLLIVDRLLPGMEGLTVIERLRERSVQVPVLVLSALSAVTERVRGLKAGGDDYLSKPFALSELAARVEALLRRSVDTRQTVLRIADLELDLVERTARRNGRLIEFLPREYKLLEYLMRRAGQVVTRAMLFEDVWHYQFVPQTNLVDVHIGKLRRKLDAGGESALIESVRGVGFVLRATP
jgi:two-component system, OmpR family, response regulator